MPALLLEENMSLEARSEALAEWDDKNDGISRYVQVATQNILTESKEVDEESVADWADDMREMRIDRIRRGKPLITEEFKDTFNTILANRHLFEDLSGNEIRGSHYRNAINRTMEQCIQVIMADIQCEKAPWTTADCFGVDTASRCPDNSHIKICENVRPLPPDCFECEAPDDPATFIGYEKQRVCWEVPKPCYKSLSYALHEDLDCENAADIVAAELREEILLMRGDEAERNRIALMFGIPNCSTCRTSSVCHTWNYDDYEIPMYQAPGDCHLWENSYVGCEFSPDPVACGGSCQDPEEFRNRLKSLWEDQEDWHTNDPVECDFGPMQFFFPTDRQSRHFNKIFGAFTREHCVDGPCDGKIEYQVGADPDFSSQYKTSRYAKECLIEWFMNHDIVSKDASGNVVTIAKTNRPTAEYRAENTYLISRNWTQTFRMLRVEDFSRSLTGTNHWHFFNRGTKDAFRQFWGEKYVPHRPWLTHRYFAFDPTYDATA